MTWVSKMFGFDKATEDTSRSLRRDPMNMTARQMRDTFYHPDQYLPRPGAERRILDLLADLHRQNNNLRSKISSLRDEIRWLKKDMED